MFQLLYVGFFMNKFYCLLLSAILLSGCFGKSNNDTMPSVEVAVTKSTTDMNAGNHSARLTASKVSKDLSKAEKMILAASNLTAAEMGVYAELETFAHEFITKSNNSFVPCKRRPKIESRNGYVTISYMEIDHASINLEILPAKSKYFEYIAKMRYVERHFQSTGIDFDSALNGQFKVLASRRVTELPRYVQSRWVE